ncbi:vWA domain-containing protein [Halopiger xanaduensis]|uniref:vWA domain-containing protein n=1 Tax=Halopiger xanaduensis TaxID=387343 RepID=UPI001494E652|nr:vWA domain-containing protein [Halopiger xanaduensis]
MTVIAPIEGENPFASHVGIDPTIYGGLYADDDLTIDESVTVDRYNGTVGWVSGNVTEDLLVANGELELASDANITGVPVVDGHFSGKDGAETSNIAFATDPAGTRIDEINGTEVYNVTDSTPPELFGAKLSESFDGIDDIDQQTERAIRLIDEYEDSNPIASEKLESESDKNVDGFYYEDSDIDGDDIDEFDTSNGDIHVAVDGNVELDGVDVTGDGRAYLYVSGDIDTDGVTVDGDQAQNFWIYGSSDADVTVRNVFQGVMYTPESNSLTVAKDTAVYGSIVAGEGIDIGENVSIHFDETLRTDVPIPEENRDVTIEIGERRSPLDVTFVLDRSGSMRDNDPSEQRVDATKNFIGLMQGEDSSVLEGDQSDQAGVYEFNQNGYERHHLSSDLSSVNSSVETSASGGTGIYSGIEIALDEYERNRSSSAEQHMILLSDGQNDPATEWVCTDGGWLGCDNWEFYDYNQQTLDQAERAADMNVTIHTIGLSDDADSDMLGDIANETDGDYYPAEDDDELEEIFEGIADKVTASSPTTFEVASVDEPTASPHDYAVNVREHPVNIGG